MTLHPSPQSPYKRRNAYAYLERISPNRLVCHQACSAHNAADFPRGEPSAVYLHVYPNCLRANAADGYGLASQRPGCFCGGLQRLHVVEQGDHLFAAEYAVYADDHSADAGHHRRGRAHPPWRGRAGAPFAGVYSLYLPRDLAADLHGVLRLLADAAGVCGGDSSAADRVVARYYAAHRHSVLHRGDCDAGVRHYAPLLDGGIRLSAGAQPEHERPGDYAHQPHHHEGQPHEFLPAGVVFHRLESADCRA